MSALAQALAKARSINGITEVIETKEKKFSHVLASTGRNDDFNGRAITSLTEFQLDTIGRRMEPIVARLQDTILTGVLPEVYGWSFETFVQGRELRVILKAIGEKKKKIRRETILTGLQAQGLTKSQAQAWYTLQLPGKHALLTTVLSVLDNQKAARAAFWNIDWVVGEDGVEPIRLKKWEQEYAAGLPEGWGKLYPNQKAIMGQFVKTKMFPGY